MSKIFARSAVAGLVVLIVPCFLAVQAEAQVNDPNLLNRLESFIPEAPPPTPPTRMETRTRVVPEVVTEEVAEPEEVPLPQMEAEFVETQVEGKVPPPAGIFEMSPEAVQSAYIAQAVHAKLLPDDYLTMSIPAKRGALVDREIKGERTRFLRKTRTIYVSKTETVAEPTKVAVSLSATSSFDWQSNANQSPDDPIEDSIANNSALLEAVFRIGKTEDTFSTVIAPSAARYSKLDGDSSDLLSGTLTYTHPFSPRYVSQYKTDGTATIDRIALTFNAFGAFDPGFGTQKVQASTPGIGWSRKNIPIGSLVCGEKGAENYCYFLNVSAGLGNSWSSKSSQDRFFGTFGFTVNWRTPIKKLVLAAGANLSAASYRNVVGGREDFIVNPVLRASWTPNDYVSFSAGAQYTDQTSSLSTAAWDGFQMTPKANLQVKF
ncbi:hypothetical protein V6C03_00410 [Methyloligella sp. 2.7D]|uniref:hypothetical protein n=1 Tax=unclassified Methyloligella TaxID=2625955 RepID=UPI00157C1B02|nr:hypothetical protein [Methyloligella sp. GL2]QKP76866.1 hypothetical protein HT051_05005 [Methyloligella sp. GL2]